VFQNRIEMRSVLAKYFKTLCLHTSQAAELPFVDKQPAT